MKLLQWFGDLCLCPLPRSGVWCTPKQIWWLWAGRAAWRAGLGDPQGSALPGFPVLRDLSAPGALGWAAFPSPRHSRLRALGKPLAAGEAPLSANSNYSSPELLGEESCAGELAKCSELAGNKDHGTVSRRLLFLIVLQLEC